MAKAMSTLDQSNVIHLWMDDVVQQDMDINGYIRHLEDQIFKKFASVDYVSGTEGESLYHPKTSTGERVIDKKDNREIVKNTKKSFHPAIAHMIMIFPDKKLRGKEVYFNGTGFLCALNNKAFLLTAKHNINASTAGTSEFSGRSALFSSRASSAQRAKEVRIYFARNGIKNKPYDCITVPGRSFQIPYTSRDYAVLDLSSETAKLPKERLDVTSLTEAILDKSFQIAGYPGCRSYGTRTYGAEPYTQWLTPRVKANLDGHHLKYKEATEGGNSGSPLVFKNKRKGCWSVIGVHISGGEEYNYAEACDDDMISTITRWLDVKKSTPFDTPKLGKAKLVTTGTTVDQSGKKSTSAFQTKTTGIVYPRPREYGILKHEKIKPTDVFSDIIQPNPKETTNVISRTKIWTSSNPSGSPHAGITRLKPNEKPRSGTFAARSAFFDDLYKNATPDKSVTRMSSPVVSYKTERSSTNVSKQPAGAASYSLQTTRVITRSTTTQKYTIPQHI